MWLASWMSCGHVLVRARQCVSMQAEHAPPHNLCRKRVSVFQSPLLHHVMWCMLAVLLILLGVLYAIQGGM